MIVENDFYLSKKMFKIAQTFWLQDSEFELNSLYNLSGGSWVQKPSWTSQPRVQTHNAASALHILPEKVNFEY